MRASLQILYIHWEWPSILGQKTKLLRFILPSFSFFSISHSNVIYIGKCVTNISQELLHTEFCNWVQMLWIICCFMWKRTRLLLLILPLISSFFFLSNFQISHNFISLFSGTERPTKLKLGPHMNSRLVYHVYLESGCWSYFFISSIFFLSNSKTLKFLSHFSLRPTKLKLDTHMGNGLIYCVHQIQAARIYLFLYFLLFFCLSN